MRLSRTPSTARTTARRLAVATLGAALTLGGLAACTSGERSGARESTTPPAAAANTSPPPGAGSADPSASPSPGGTTAPSATETAAPTPAASSAFTPSKPSGPTTVWADNSMVPHLFFHSLIVNPKVAFADQESGAGYADYMVTVGEFRKMLNQVYKKGYVLVSPHQLGRVDAKGRMHAKTLRVPKGKKPLVLSIDDVSYYEYMEGDGFASKLVVSDDGSVKTEYTDPTTKKTSVGDHDVMPIVDDFVAEHPDFAPYGYKGVIALTGYNGVLGYRSSPTIYGPQGAETREDPAKENKHLQTDIAQATRVANALKASGWEFASHSWGHINFTTSSLERITADNERWKKDVEPITGPTDLLIYPFGADISGVPKYTGAKYDYLKKQGFSFFFNVDGSTPAWGQWGQGYLREARFNVDGISMKRALDGHPELGTFFNVKSVLDPARPQSISGQH